MISLYLSLSLFELFSDNIQEVIYFLFPGYFACICDTLLQSKLWFLGVLILVILVYHVYSCLRVSESERR